MKALEKNYTTTIDYPVRYRNFPSDKTLIGELPDHLNLKVYAHGYILLQHKISSRYIPLIISVRSFSLNKMRGEDSNFYFLETRFVKDYIDKQLSSEFEILEVKPDTLIFPFATVKSKRVPVYPRISYTLDQQLMLKDDIVLTPDSVKITGPDYLIDTLRYVSTRIKDFGVVSRSRIYKLDISPLKHTTLYPGTIEVGFDVERFTEKTISVPVEVEGAPDGFRLISFPLEIKVNCQVGLSNYEQLQPEMFRAIVRYSDIISGEEQLKVNLVKSPAFVSAVKFTPRTVEYLIEK